MSIFNVANHDFSVYEGKTQEEIIVLLEKHDHRVIIANILVELGLLSENPWIELLGFKGSSTFDAGLIYCPHPIVLPPQ